MRLLHGRDAILVGPDYAGGVSYRLAMRIPGQPVRLITATFAYLHQWGEHYLDDEYAPKVEALTAMAANRLVDITGG